MTRKTKAYGISEALLCRQRRQLAAWLAEWHLEQTLRNATSPGHQASGWESGEAGALSRMATGQPCSPVGTDSAVGQIRLMMPDHTITRAQPLHVLILAPWSRDEWLATPFGILGTPAIPGEWRTGLRALPVRVLCVWNTRRVARDRMERSWHGRDIDSRRLDIARRLAAELFSWPVAVRQRLTAGTAASVIPPHVLGPPLVHPCDPRRQYLDAEFERWEALGPPAARPAGDRCRRGQPMPGSQGNGMDYDLVSDAYPLKKAAEPRAGYVAESDKFTP